MDGVLWPRTLENSFSEFPCSHISSLFRRETRVTRQCLDTGRWEDPDLTTCTLREDPEPFLLLWFVIEANNSSDEVMTPGMVDFQLDGTLDAMTRLALEQLVSAYYDDLTVCQARYNWTKLILHQCVHAELLLYVVSKQINSTFYKRNLFQGINSREGGA